MEEVYLFVFAPATFQSRRKLQNTFALDASEPSACTGYAFTYTYIQEECPYSLIMLSSLVLPLLHPHSDSTASPD